MTRPDPINLVLVQAGSTAWDESARLQGAGDLPLSDAGRRLMESVGAQLADAGVRTVMSGPDEGSRQSAKIIAGACGVRSRASNALAEPALGLWEGLLDEDLQDRYAKSYSAWREDPSSVTPPEGENAREAEHRVLTAIAKTLEKLEKPILVIVLRPLAFTMARNWLGDAFVVSGSVGPAPDGAHMVHVSAPRRDLEELSASLRVLA